MGNCLSTCSKRYQTYRFFGTDDFCFVCLFIFRWKGKDDEGHVEDSLVTVVVKDGVQTGQPRVVIVETVSIATQTEKIAILAAAVQVFMPRSI